MNHILIKDQSLQGKEYGTLRSFEAAVQKATSAEPVEIPSYQLPKQFIRHFGHGMNRDKYRKYFPKQSFKPQADVAWYILMGPENYQLDLYKDWNKNCRAKILYLFDTLPAQYPLIKKLLSNTTQWDILITSFNDAAADLQKITGRKWHVLEQATDTGFFSPVPLEERVIPFSAYGRREPGMHQALKAFCAARGLYYDYTMAAAWESEPDGRDLYCQYAWHLNHSIFTFSWPVELTNPQRAGHLHPITCRWFEAAAAGTVMLGKPPDNPGFDSLLFPDAVIKIDINGSRESIFKQLDILWQNRAMYHQYAQQAQLQKISQWDWQERVKRVLTWL